MQRLDAFGQQGHYERQKKDQDGLPSPVVVPPGREPRAPEASRPRVNRQNDLK
jgi:hypothetical protein